MSPHPSLSPLNPNDQTDQHRLSVLSYITPCYMLAVSVFAVFLNGSMLQIYTRGPSRKKKMLLSNLALAEFLMPSVTYWMPITSSPYGYWLYGPTGCQIYAFIAGFLGLVVVGTLTAMAVERYVVCHNFVHLHWSFKVKCQVILATWLYGFLMTVPPLIGWGRYDIDLYKSSCSWDYYSRDWNAKSFTIFLLVGGFVLPALIILYCYWKIFCRIRENEHEMHKLCLRPKLRAKADSTPLDGGATKTVLTRLRPSVSLVELNHIETVSIKPISQRKRSISVSVITMPKDKDAPHTGNSCENPISRDISRNEKQLVKVIMLVILGFVGCWTPYALLTILGQLRVESAFSPSAAAVTMLLAKTSCAVNPIIYALKEKSFRKELQKLICR